MDFFLTEHHKRTDLHYHVIVGEGAWLPHDLGNPNSLEINTVYDSHMQAYSAFIAYIRGLGAALTEADLRESLSVWEDIYEEVKEKHVLEVITYLGLGYRDLGIPIEIIACNGCVPYGMN